MSDPAVGMLMLVSFIFAILLGFPIAFTLIALSVMFGFYAVGDTIFPLLVQRAYGVMANDVLISVPLFLFMGYMIERSNILDRLFLSIQLALRRIPGSLGVATLFTCALFATATGIVGAVVTLMGVLALPAMLKAHYDKRLASGLIAAGGCLGILIPPSIMLILYGAMAGESVVRLYAGALLPGLMLAGMYIVYVIGVSIVKPELAPRLPKERLEGVSAGQVAWMLLTSFLPLTVLVLSVLGAILAGVATPSEAAAIGAIGSLVLAVAYRAFTWDKLKEAVFLTGRASAMVCWLFVGSYIFASVFALLGGHHVVEGWFNAMDLEPWQFLLLTQIIIFLLGWPLEWTEIIVIFVPIFLPLLDNYGIDPVFFGVLVALNIQTSFLSPPMAMSAFYLKGVAPKGIELSHIFRGMVPFMCIVLLSLFVLYQFPELALWLPSVIYG
ncbi:TRAP transporter large permease [Niveispirillum sp. KHB5.9]|uniref:TRAP transporter large permease n=1 Tax=Niveispirillum sp. KHB5.9 TaxID=3400269 RepID=UPI003A85C937